MSMFKMPVFTWMTLITSILIVLALPVLAVAGIQLQADRLFGTHFYNSLAGGDPVLWQHMFWLFGHPEVYILILPAMGIVSDVIPVFSRKPLFGYAFVIFAGIAIAFLGWFVWSHHMFTVGLGPAANSAFAISTMLIGLPTGVKIFNWLATLYKGRISFEAPMLYAIIFLLLFAIGGLTGIFLGALSVDIMLHDTYFVVAHFHYTLFPIVFLGSFTGIYHWYPKMTGRMFNNTLGKVHFWVTFLGVYSIYLPMHYLGFLGVPRRYFAYEGISFSESIQAVNANITIAALIVGVTQLLFLFNLVWSLRNGKPAEHNPWGATTLEWHTPDKVPGHGNWGTSLPTVHRWAYDYSVPGASQDFLPQTMSSEEATSLGAKGTEET